MKDLCDKLTKSKSLSLTRVQGNGLQKGRSPKRRQERKASEGRTAGGSGARQAARGPRRGACNTRHHLATDHQNWPFAEPRRGATVITRQWLRRGRVTAQPLSLLSAIHPQDRGRWDGSCRGSPIRAAGRCNAPLGPFGRYLRWKFINNNCLPVVTQKP